MTVREAIDNQNFKIRLPRWAKDCYVELPQPGVGVWVKIHDPYFGNTEVTIFELINDSSTEWENYQPTDTLEQI